MKKNHKPFSFEHHEMQTNSRTNLSFLQQEDKGEGTSASDCFSKKTDLRTRASVVYLLSCYCTVFIYSSLLFTR